MYLIPDSANRGIRFRSLLKLSFRYAEEMERLRFSFGLLCGKPPQKRKALHTQYPLPQLSNVIFSNRQASLSATLPRTRHHSCAVQRQCGLLTPITFATAYTSLLTLCETRTGVRSDV